MYTHMYCLVKRLNYSRALVLIRIMSVCNDNNDYLYVCVRGLKASVFCAAPSDALGRRRARQDAYVYTCN